MGRSRIPAVILLACLAVAAGPPDPVTPGSAANGAAAPGSQTSAAIGLADLELIAQQRNPTLAEAGANVEAARGRALQSGLYPNPTVGYNGEQIGAPNEARRRTAGEQQGLFIDQTFVTAGKLRLNRARYCQEVTQAELQAQAQQFRVLNGVCVRFYQLLAMQRLLDVRAELLKVAEDAVTTTEELANVGAANRADLLQARIEARQERVGLENARALYAAAWQQLNAFLGNPGLPADRLRGDLESGCAVPDFDATLAHLLAASPEAQVARVEITRSQFALRREQAETVPNLNVRVSTGYDFQDRGVTTSVQVGGRLPVFDRNQGNIRSAQAQLARAQAEVTRVELSLAQRLAREYARYRTAAALVESYRKDNLPEAREAFELYLDSFRKRRAAWPQVLVAQRTYFQIRVDYVQALEQMRRSEVAILGLLLVDGLEEPPGPPSEGRIQRRGAGGRGCRPARADRPPRRAWVGGPDGQRHPDRGPGLNPESSPVGPKTRPLGGRASSRRPGRFLFSSVSHARAASQQTPRRHGL
jgi:cobalt-zinc-cadmium efflux system outer membrane protein